MRHHLPNPLAGRRAGDDGSMILALLGVLMSTGMIVVLFSLTMNVMAATREDRDFQFSLHGGDTGVYQALTQISLLSDPAVGSLSATGGIGDASFSWTAERVGSAWRVTSQGTRGERSRKIEATVARASTFLIGAFADVAFTMRGSNGADSYDSASGETGTGMGSIGSNGAITMNGNAFADRILLYGEPASCSGNGCSSGDIEGSDTPFNIDAVTAAIEQGMDANCSAGFSAYQSSLHGTLTPGVHCFTSMLIDTDTLVGAAAAWDNPVIVYLTGNLDMSNNTRLNCATCFDAASTPDAGALQIYSTGPQVTLGNHVFVAAGIAAPNASCQGSPSNAQAEIYGSMICSDLSNQGGWNFHFDTNLLRLGNGYWDITDWREERNDTTSFAAAS